MSDSIRIRKPFVTYKAFKKDFTCLDFKYKVGETYKINGKLKLCRNGFHSCRKLSDCFKYYGHDKSYKYAEVLCMGSYKEDNDKLCSSQIKIVRELSWDEVNSLVNPGKRNVGIMNSGDDNVGDKNTGNNNHGLRNSGTSNFGDYNSGHRNIGCNNTGSSNDGQSNSGNGNLGDRNSGNYNIVSNSSGFFSTVTPKVTLFDLPTNLSDYQIRIMLNFINLKLVDDNGKTVDYKTAWQNCWKKLSTYNKNLIIGLPNFDAAKFLKITGIKV